MGPEMGDPPGRPSRTCSCCFYTVTVYRQHEGYVLCLRCEKAKADDAIHRRGYTKETLGDPEE